MVTVKDDYKGRLLSLDELCDAVQRDLGGKHEKEITE